MRAAARWTQAHLTAHRPAAVLTALATAGITISLLLATALFAYAADPWQRAFTQSSGAHVWIHTQGGAPAGSLAGLDEVRATSGPFRTVRTTASLQPGDARATLELRGAAKRPATAAPQIVAGRWLDAHTDAGTDAGATQGIVLESSVARAMWAKPGDTIVLSGFAAHLRVVGVADTAEVTFRAGETPGVAWVLPATLDASDAGRDQHGRTIGLQLGDPADTDYVVQRAVTRLGADQITDVSTWRQAKAAAEGDNQLLGRLLGLFGLGALLAAALAVGGAISTRIRGHLRDISILKAIGFTPGQVVRMFVALHLGLALLGVALGALLTQVVGTLVPGRIGEAIALWRQLPGHAWLTLVISGGVVTFIGAATCLAAWRAGRVPPVPVARAATAAGGRASALTRRALGLRVPPALVLGWRGAFHRPLRSSAAVARLAVPLLLITIALGAWTTLDRFSSHPENVGLPAALTARSDTLDDRELRQLLGSQREMTAYPGAEVQALVPGQTGTITLRGLGTDARPYPGAVVEGRAAHGSDEAVAGQGLLDLLDARVGDWVRMTVAGQPHVLHIVGRSIETTDGGRVVSTTLDTLREGDSDDPAPRADAPPRPDFYQLVLHPGADPDSAREALSKASGGRLEVRETPNPADQLSAVRAVSVGLIAVLTLIGLVELATTVGAGVRDRSRDLLALRAVGLTPRQITAVIVSATAFITLAAALAGTTLGVLASQWLINLQGRASGWGAGIAQRPAPGILLLVIVVAVLIAATAAVLPAARAARRRLADSATDLL
ncbi:FtsX-like permease family protein [Streptomyces sp. RPA4-5]|uniref:ABC transporter permease n=1 Tax=unclassified Streptomyces TaxID=2593676 RepID=UPI00143E695F|nr:MULTISPECIES: FtsX-like permease family protein [unclassified Streptomyces]QIY53304.1 FtsX-like permease family protein [Streptomyces sp. RPA4-5]WJY35943.1 FtsX-like permease family protein [Streptomyces sp. P9-2B-2]